VALSDSFKRDVGIQRQGVQLVNSPPATVPSGYTASCILPRRSPGPGHFPPGQTSTELVMTLQVHAVI
jgi:hypothetical protein